MYEEVLNIADKAIEQQMKNLDAKLLQLTKTKNNIDAQINNLNNRKAGLVKQQQQKSKVVRSIRPNTTVKTPMPDTVKTPSASPPIT